MLGETSDLRKDRDMLKLERGEMLVKQQKELEEARNQHRLLTSECERLSFKLSCSDEEKQKHMLKLEKRQSELSAYLAEKT